MSLMDMIKRGNSLDKDFDEMQSSLAEAIDEDMAEAIDKSMARDVDEAAPPAVDPGPTLVPPLPELELELDLEPELEPDPVPPANIEVAETKRLTGHAQSRLAALESFDKLYHDAQEHLQQIDSRLSEVTTSQVLTRRFFNIIQSDIHRANELELANAGLMAETKKLSEQLAEAARKQQERDGIIENLRHREASLSHDNELLRASVAAAKLDLVEAANATARSEAKLGDAIKTVSSQTVEAERRTREIEVLREKQVSLSVDLDKSLKREAEAQRKLEEMAAIQASAAAQHAEIVAALSRSEKEVLRLQMAIETAQMKQAEMTEAALIVEADREGETARAVAEARGLRSEIEDLQSRLAAAATEQTEAAAVIAGLKLQLSDAVSEKQVADEKLLAFMEQHEKDKNDLSAASANMSQLALQQETEQIQLDIHRQECEDLRAEIAVLNGRIKELLPFERLYKVTKARQHGGGGSGGESESVPEIIGVAAPKPRASVRRAAASARGRAG